jgi:uncharacterized protein (TIGR00251 family)
MKLRIKIIPQAQHNKIVGWQNNTLKIKINASPKKGKANKELIKFLTKEWNISKSEIVILKGEKSRTKILQIPKSTALILPKKF